MVWYQVMLSETKQKQSNNIPGSFAARFWSLLQACRERIDKELRYTTIWETGHENPCEFEPHHLRTCPNSVFFL